MTKRISLFCRLNNIHQISHSVVSNSLLPHESQHTRPPCPSPTPRVYPDSRPSSQWCHPAILSSVVPFSSCPQTHHSNTESFSNESTLRMRWPKYWSFSFSILPSKEIPRGRNMDTGTLNGNKVGNCLLNFRLCYSQNLSFLCLLMPNKKIWRQSLEGIERWL